MVQDRPWGFTDNTALLEFFLAECISVAVRYLHDSPKYERHLTTASRHRAATRPFRALFHLNLNPKRAALCKVLP